MFFPHRQALISPLGITIVLVMGRRGYAILLSNLELFKYFLFFLDLNFELLHNNFHIDIDIKLIEVKFCFPHGE